MKENNQQSAFGHPGIEPRWTRSAKDGVGTAYAASSGSEVSLCVNAYEQLKAEGIRARVVSLPSWEIFEQQSEEYQNSVIPPDVNERVSVEQASTFGWARFVGRRGHRIGMKTFGASAPLKELQKKFGFNTEAVVAAAKEMIGKAR